MADYQENDELLEFKADAEDSSVADATGVRAKKRIADKSDAGEPMQKVSALRSDEVGGDLINKNTTSKFPARKADKSMKEEVSALFDGELSEEFLDRASTIFEAAVIDRVNVEKAALEEEYASALNEAVEEVKTELSEKVDEYLNYVVEQWMDENRVAVESGIKAEVTESFFKGLKNLFAEHYVDVPDDKVDLAESLAVRVAELEGELNEALSRNIDLTTEIEKAQLASAFDEITEGMSVSQKEKLSVLAESLVFSSVDEFKSKLEVIKESYSGSKIQPRAEETLNEEFVEDDKSSEKGPSTSDPMMQAYLQAVKKTVKK